MGEYESLNLAVGIDTNDITLVHALYRTSIKGRKDAAKLMFADDDGSGVVEGTLDRFYTSRVVEMWQVILKCMGIEMTFVDDNQTLHHLDQEELKYHYIEGKHYMCTDYQAFLLERIYDIRKEVLDEYSAITSATLKKEIIKRLKEYDYVTGTAEDAIEIFKMDSKLLMTKSQLKEYEKSLIEESEEEDEVKAS